MKRSNEPIKIHSTDNCNVYSIRLSVELYKNIIQSKAPDAVAFNISLEDKCFKFNVVKESQPVDLVRLDDELHVVGQVKTKISVSSVLGAQKQDEMKLKTEEAERMRLARKSQVIEQSEVKKKVTRHPIKVIGRNSESPVLSPEPNGDRKVPLRTRLLQLLALKPLTLSDLVSRVASNQKEVLAELEKIAAKQGPVYSLKPESFKLVKTKDWPSYSSKEREAVIMNVKAAFRTLGIPIDDTLYRDTDSDSSVKSIAQVANELKPVAQKPTNKLEQMLKRSSPKIQIKRPVKTEDKYKEYEKLYDKISNFKTEMNLLMQSNPEPKTLEEELVKHNLDEMISEQTKLLKLHKELKETLE